MDSETRKLDAQEAARIPGAGETQAYTPAPTTPVPPLSPVPPVPPVYNAAPSAGPAPVAPPRLAGPSPVLGAPRPAGPALTNHNNLIALILIALGLWFFLGPSFSLGAILGSSVVLVIGLVFLYVYFNQGRNFGFLVPGAILTGLGAGIVAEALTSSSGWVPLGLGLGFCAIWFLYRQHWWALIPGGIIALSGLSELARTGGGWLGWSFHWGGNGGSFWTLMLILLGVWLIFGRSGRRSRR